MSRKQIIIVSAVGLFVVAAVILGVVTKGGRSLTPSGPENKGGVSAPASGEGNVKAFSQTVPEDAKPTKPASVAPAAPGSTAQSGLFYMTVSADGFNPSDITVKKGDTLTIRLTAKGGDFDISVPGIGLYNSVKDGETKPISFGANTAGTYGFSCRDFCPSGRVISGTIVVLP